MKGILCVGEERRRGEKKNTANELNVFCFQFLGPAFGGIIWSWSLTNNLSFPFNQYFVFVILSLIAFLAWCQSLLIPDSVRFIGDDDDEGGYNGHMHLEM